MGDARSDLSEFLRGYADGLEPLAVGADLFDSLGVEGDDAVEFMDEFAARFEVDLSDYRWYFHHGEEGFNFGGLIFRPRYGRVRRMPITADILLEAIQTRRWPLRYPDHDAPKVRWDIHLNQLLAVAALGLLAQQLWTDFVR